MYSLYRQVSSLICYHVFVEWLVKNIEQLIASFVGGLYLRKCIDYFFVITLDKDKYIVCQQIVNQFVVPFPIIAMEFEKIF